MGQKRAIRTKRTVIRRAKYLITRSKTIKTTQKYARMEAKLAVARGIKFTRYQVAIRPRLGFSFRTISILVMLLIASIYASTTLSEKREDIRVNGHAVLVAEKHEANHEAEIEVSGTTSFKISPFDYVNPVENGLISQKFSSYHRGLDIATTLGSPIKPIGSGVVEFAGFTRDGKGNVVIIDHGDGLKTVYAHMGKIEVGSGNMVGSNMEIGTVGITGRTTGPHLHLEVYDRDVAINPVSLLP